MWAELTVTNLGKRRFRVAEVLFVQDQDAKTKHHWTSSGRWGLPWALEPGEIRKCTITWEDAVEASLDRHLRAGIKLTTGETFESACASLRDHKDQNNTHLMTGSSTFQTLKTQLDDLGGENILNKNPGTQ